MGVTGLWQLVEPAGKPVPLETLENKVLAVDISIWLHQMVKGYRDGHGGAMVNAHILGLFQRLCKLLYYRIKPVFVFDGGCPDLKMQTIIQRKNQKSQMRNNVDRVKQQLMEILLKQTAVKHVLSTTSPSDKKSPTKRSPVKPSNESYDEQLFKLPPMVVTDTEEDNEMDSSEESDSEDKTSTKHQIDLHSIDVKSEYFKSLTPREKHDLLTELKETRKQSSWGRLHELPVQSDDFSNYQMNRLLKRRQVQVSLEEAEKEIGGHFLSINELEVLLNEEGISTKIEQLPTRRIASDDSTRFILIKDVREAIETATKRDAITKNDTTDKIDALPSASENGVPQSSNKLGNEFDENLKAAIQLSLGTSNVVKSLNENDSVDFTQFGGDFVYDTDSDWSMEDESDNETNDLRSTELSLAKAYMLENSGLSEYEIMRIINTQKAQKNKIKKVKRIIRSPENTQQNEITKPITQNGEVITTNDECKLNKEIEQKFFVDSKTNEKKDDKGIFKPTDENKSVGLPEIENVILSSEDDEEDEVILNTEKSGDISESSSSDTDDSFEEVPEPSLTNEILKQPLLQLVVKPETVLEDDIFADVFQVTNQPKLLNQCDNSVTKKINQISEVNPVINPIAVPPSDIIKNVEKLENNHSTIPIIGNKKDLLHEDQSSAIESDHTSLTPHNQSSVNVDASNESPQKGMTLNKIRHLISHEEEPKTSNETESQNTKKDIPIASQRISAKELSVLAEDLEVQKENLEKEHNKLDRMGRDVSQQMTSDAQALLKMFGVPYIVAPKEAEAQCAFLETINLTDGTITDDSDIWLFGGKTVYKNFFNQQKYVLQFLSENIQQCFKLPREHLILFALLVGSDYTTGINGVGPVTALEILATFPPTKTELVPPYVTLLAGLKKFRSCHNSKTMRNSNLGRKLKNISLSEEFPSYRVVEAYLSPEVETSNEKFCWGKPDLTAIRDFAREKFGWAQTKTDEILLPVLKRLDEKISQQSIRSFFRTEVKQADASEKMSKRVKSAVERLGGDIIADASGIEGPSASKKPKIVNERKRKAKPKKDVQPKDVPAASSEGIQEIVPLPQASVVTNNIKAVQKEASEKFSYPKRHIERFPQREKDKNKILQNKIKAIELFRTSKKGPGFVNKRKKAAIRLKEDAELSENSD